MDHLFNLDALPWKTVRPDVTSGVFGQGHA